jgi:hypothetical protein
LPLCFQIAFFLILPPSFDIEFIISVVHFVTSSEWKFTDRWTRFRINYPTKTEKKLACIWNRNISWMFSCCS